ncbi:hypothetical protein [Nonomuraea soli]|uniref:Uncharacterized protein n=1 Tax=Nonomuraea soli TaxID=1032476 RepID=A0A7W0CRG6_9ACTN|nr:hypothetical protein [Nonomuraea soli]MBA2895947.1 hypothetical protein [Nonomuraea soli]
MKARSTGLLRGLIAGLAATIAAMALYGAYGYFAPQIPTPVLHFFGPPEKSELYVLGALGGLVIGLSVAAVRPRTYLLAAAAVVFAVVTRVLGVIVAMLAALFRLGQPTHSYGERGLAYLRTYPEIMTSGDFWGTLAAGVVPAALIVSLRVRRLRGKAATPVVETTEPTPDADDGFRGAFEPAVPVHKPEGGL